MNYIITTSTGEELYHHGIMGQRWGIRRYQNEDGTLTEAGKARYGNIHESSTYTNKYGETIKYDSTRKQKDYNNYGEKGEKRIEKRLDSGNYRTYQEAQKEEQKRKNIKALAITLPVTALAIMSPMIVADLAMDYVGYDSVIINTGKKAIKAGQNYINGIKKDVEARRFIDEVISDENLNFDEVVDATEYLLEKYLKQG